MRGIARRCLGERARKIKFLLVLMGLCSLYFGGSYTAWAAETFIPGAMLADTHTSSATLYNDLRLNYTRGRFSGTVAPEYDAKTGTNVRLMTIETSTAIESAQLSEAKNCP